MVEDYLVAIFDQEEQSCHGAGIMFMPGRILTCAHVVNAALGRAHEAVEVPTGTLKIILVGQTFKLDATVDNAADAWSPPRNAEGVGNDLCILTTKTIYTKSRTASFRSFAEPSNRAIRALGFPTEWKGGLDIAEGVILGRDGDRYMVRTTRTGVAPKSIFGGEVREAGVIHHGFSGGPVESEGEIIGLIVAAREPQTGTAYVVPASTFPARFQSLIRRQTSEAAEQFPHVNKFQDILQKSIGKDSVLLDLRVRFCGTFSEALEAHRPRRSACVHTEYKDGIDLSADAFIKHLLSKTDPAGESLTKPFILHAPGGGGKTSFLARLISRAPAENVVPFYLNFSKSQGSPSAESPNGDQEQLEEWFTQFEQVGTSKRLVELSERSQKFVPLLVIDAFNQAKRSFSSDLKKLLSISRGVLSGAAIIVADRMVDHLNGADDFQHLVIPPLPESVYLNVLERIGQVTLADEQQWQPILTSPLFLELLMRNAGGNPNSRLAKPSRFAVLNQYFRNICNLENKELAAIAKFAFRMYRDNHSTAIPNANCEALFRELGASSQAKLESKEIIRPLDSSTSQFRHQILHDWMAILYLASARKEEEEKLLRSPAFGAVTLDAASHDAIELAVEAVSSPSDLLQTRNPPLAVSDFIAEVFDWNYWITFECVASIERRGESQIPEYLYHVVYVHDVEKRFDPFLHTASSALYRNIHISETVGRSYADASSRDDVVNAVKDIFLSHPDWSDVPFVKRWLAVYTRDVRVDPYKVAELDVLWADPFLSWTGAHSIRRGGADTSLTAELLRLYEFSKATSDSAAKAAMFRWRLVHVLGRGTALGLEPLFNFSFDSTEDRQVRYGALRSLVQLLATGDDCGRLDFIDRIADSIPLLFDDKTGRNLRHVRRELRRACAFNEPHVAAKEEWRERWLHHGLPKYEALLAKGASAAKNAGHEAEAAIWQQWLNTVRNVQASKNWEERKGHWLSMIVADR